MATASTAAGSVATIEALTTEATDYYEMTLLNRAIARYYYCPFALVGDVPKGKYRYQWAAATALSAATTPVTEGVTPASEAMTMTTTHLEPLQYGSFIRHSDKLDLQALHPQETLRASLLGEQAGLTADTLCRNLMVASGTAQIADSVALRTSLATTNLLDAAEISQAFATLINNNARGWDFLDGRFAVVLSAFAWHDLMRDAEMRNAAQQALPRSEEHPFWTGEVFDYMRCRFFLTSNAYYEADGGASTVDAYLTMVIGRDAFGIGGMGAQGFRPDLGAGGTGNELRPVEIIQQPLGSAGEQDPMKQRASTAWSGYQQEIELNSSWAVRIEHACSLGSN